MNADFTVEVTGDEEFQRKLEQMARDLGGAAFRGAMMEAATFVSRAAKLNLKPWSGPGTGGVDTGRMRSSITPEVRTRDNVVQGVVGSNVAYAPFQEEGFRPHFVPARYIGRWAERHGLGYRGVFVTGKALHFLRRAFEDNTAKVIRILEDAVSRIVDR